MHTKVEKLCHRECSVTCISYAMSASGPGWQMDMVSIWKVQRSRLSSFSLSLPPSISPVLFFFLPSSLPSCLPSSLYLPPSPLLSSFSFFFPLTYIDIIFLFFYGNIETIETCFCFSPSLGADPFHLWFSQFPSKLNIKQISLLTADPKLGHAVVLPLGVESWADKGRGETGWSQFLSPGEAQKLCLCLHISQTANSQTTDSFWKAFL